MAHPVALDSFITGYSWGRDPVGRSPSEVFRLERAGTPALYLKREARSGYGELADEAARLRWLSGQGMPCPDIIAFTADDDYDWLLMSALPGRDLASDLVLDAEARVVMLASALRALHSLDIASCPFDHRWSKRLAVAERRMRAGLVDEGDFDEARLGRSAADLYSELCRMQVDVEDLVVTHGDACLPNFVASGDAFAGCIDCGRLGVADRYQDIALACRSIVANFGETLVEPFCWHYGIVSLDAGKMLRYQMFDEFF
ncbi:APH(3') family aminoglycoside O-phosphotransferase [Rhizobium sp. NPDC090275]|uniref:APH(3') family aminoglycoside O-phosphotransferase n=1 Tax=Rhizobium sp. NPDC090275 TaxID=3364498 RepID=UPI00383B2189